MALMGLKLVSGAVLHLWDRAEMEKRDKEIDQERAKERLMEANPVQLHEITIKHFTHDHPLRKLHLDEAFECGSCSLSSSDGWAFVCEEAACGYRLHEVCSRPPVSLRQTPTMDAGAGCISTFAHRPSDKDHLVKDVFSNLEFQCGHCFTNGKGRRYKCTDCDISLHPVCAKHPTRLSTFMHPHHELELRTMEWFKNCQICGHSTKAGQKSLNLRVYGCQECKFWVHPVCSQLPQYLLHDLHLMDPLHPLQLKWVKSSATPIQCDANCGSNCTTGWQYICTICSVSFHIECILRNLLQDKSEKQRSNMIEHFLDLGNIIDAISWFV